MKYQVLVICGPTSTGKTSLAVNLANRVKSTTIISADSRQAYRELSVVSGKDIPVDLDPSCKYIGIDLFSADRPANIANFASIIKPIISKEISEKRKVIIVGGSGLYLKAILENVDTMTIPPDEILRAELSNYSLPELQQKLKTLNLDLFSSLNNSDLQNPRRLIRKIEISQSGTNSSNSFNSYPTLWVGLSLSRENLVTKIRSRVIDRINHGAIIEVKNLLQKYPSNLPIFSTLGVKEIIQFIKEEINLEKLIELWTASEVKYVKRQITWFKKQPQIIWYDETIDRNKLALELATKI